MREFIKNIETYGTLKIKSDDLVIEDVRAEYRTEYYRNNLRYGIFYVKYLSADFQNNFKENKKFEFITLEQETIKGYLYDCNWVEYKQYHFALYFRIKETFSWFRYNLDVPKKILINFRIPYIKVFERDLYKTNDYNKDFVIKFQSEPIKINIKGSKFIFNEKISLLEHTKPDSIFSRNIVPSVEIELIGKYNLLGIIKINQSYLDDIMLMISFLVCNSMCSLGYTCVVYSDNGSHIDTITYSNFNKVLDNEFVDEKIYHKFTDEFNDSNIENLVSAFLEVKTPKLKRIIHSYLTADELKILEPRFFSAFFVLEGICKMIFYKRGLKLFEFDKETQSKTEEIIRIVCSDSGVDLSKIDFTKNTKKNKFKWLISEYRNALVHVNEIKINMDLLHRDTERILLLSRKLILNHIYAPLTDFPFHKMTRNLLS